MEKTTLIAMYEKKDPKRRKKLYAFFRSVFDQQLSTAMTVELINRDLGSDLIIPYDVKYIRARVAKNAKPGLPAQPKPAFLPAIDNQQVDKATVWSDPDEVKTNSFKGSKLIKS